MDDIVKTAEAIARDAHFGVTDKSGVDYINHPLTVASFVNTPTEKCVALLHDVLEDSDKYTEEDLRRLVGDRVVDSLLLLTHDKEVPYFDYVRKIKHSNDPVAVAVKRADLRHNSDVRRLGKRFFEKGKFIKNSRNLIKYLLCRVYLAI